MFLAVPDKLPLPPIMEVRPTPIFTSDRQVWYLVLGFLVASAMIRLIATPHAVWIDEAEQIYHSQWMQPGAYDAQPPLYTWIHHLVFTWTGPNLFFIIIFKFVVVITTFLGVRKIFEIVCGRDSLPTILGLLSYVFIFQYWDAGLLSTNTLLVTWASAWSVYIVIRMTQQPGWGMYLLLGMILGVGYLSKYNFLLAILALLVTGLSIKKTRDIIWSPRVVLILVGFLLITFPHVIWFLDNYFSVESTLQFELGNKDEVNTIAGAQDTISSFSVKLISFLGIWILVILLFFRKAFWKDIAVQSHIWAVFFKRYLLIVTLLIILSALIFEIRIFHERYFQPFYLFLPLLVFLHVKDLSAISSMRIIWFQRISVITMFLIFCFNSLPFITDPLLGKPGYMHIPYDRIGQWVESEKTEGDLIITNHILMAGNLKLNMADTGTVLDWKDSEHLLQENVNQTIKSHLYVWIDEGEGVQDMIASFKIIDPGFDPNEIRYNDIPYHTPEGKSIRIGMARVDTYH